MCEVYLLHLTVISKMCLCRCGIIVPELLGLILHSFIFVWLLMGEAFVS